MNAIANPHICLLNDSIRRAFALISSVVPLSADEIKKLEDSRNGWQQLRTKHFADLLLVTTLVAVGVMFEGPELGYEIFRLIQRLLRKFSPIRVFGAEEKHDELPGWVKVIGLFGWILVFVGVAGEFWADRWVNRDDGNIESINITLLRDANSSATSAATAAQNAQGSAATAKSNAGDAKTEASAALGLARGARAEADAYKQEITSATAQAADAVSRLADAEQRLADAVQREAKAELELKNIRSPRSLRDVPKFVAALAPFKGTEYVLNTFADQESMKLTLEIGKALKQAGWVRKQPLGMRIGIPTMAMVFEGGAGEMVPTCVDTGVAIDVHTKESLSDLNSKSLLSAPMTVQAGTALRNALAATIVPPADENVAVGIIDPTLGEGPITICVGKKPL